MRPGAQSALGAAVPPGRPKHLPRVGLDRDKAGGWGSAFGALAVAAGELWGDVVRGRRGGTRQSLWRAGAGRPTAAAAPNVGLALSIRRRVLALSRAARRLLVSGCLVGVARARRPEKPSEPGRAPEARP